MLHIFQMAEIIKKQWHCIKIMSAKRRSGRYLQSIGNVDYICKRWRRCPACVRICVKDRTTVWDRLPQPDVCHSSQRALRQDRRMCLGRSGRIPRSGKESKRSRRRFYQDHDLRDHGLWNSSGRCPEEPLAPEEIRELIHIAHEEGWRSWLMSMGRMPYVPQLFAG